ncbi:hypothetical protein Bca52824_040041 [Brassica carinata]|uniref:C3H1-type domain-containing protein n=1 Tax=Brassica carinata TaxID=52824 RepID=A0A8X7UWF3_BRACI|nr:hypothetical protein Bca52824_040041 [Brassica carinata]
MSKPDPDPKPPSGSSTEKDPVADHVTEELSDDLRNVGLSDEATEELSVPINVSEGDGETDQKAEDEDEEEGRERVEKRMMVYPVRPDAEDCSFYIRTGSCKYGSSCKFNHPVRRKLQIGREKVKEKEREENVENPRLMECKYYFRTGGCKYGETCRFSHTKEHTPLPSRPELNFLGLPIRPGEKECPFYMRNGSCKFGGDCKFNHPDPTAVGGVDSPLFRGNNGGSFAPKDAPQASSTSWSSPRHMNGTGTAPFIPVMYSQNRGVSPQTPEWSGYQAPSAYPPERNILPPSTYSANNSLAETSSFSQLQSTEEFPERPDQPECSYYVKTGDCKLPKQSPSSFNDKGLPLRPEQSMCTHYSRYGICKFGPACRFDHSIPPTFSSTSSQTVETPQRRRQRK